MAPNFLHLGVDFNVRAGARVYAPRLMRVVLVDDDTPEEGGWGNRVIARVEDRRPGEKRVYFIFAHLSPEIHCTKGTLLSEGTFFAEVGDLSHNGGWFEHMHFQVVEGESWENKYAYNLASLDGYGNAWAMPDLAREFLNPFLYLPGGERWGGI